MLAERIIESIFSAIDFLPTIASLAGFEVPDERRIAALDQAGLLPGHRMTGRERSLFHAARVP